MTDHQSGPELDARVPDDAPWIITDDTGGMFELRWPPNWTSTMIYKWDYAVLVEAWASNRGRVRHRDPRLA